MPNIFLSENQQEFIVGYLGSLIEEKELKSLNIMMSIEKTEDVQTERILEGKRTLVQRELEALRDIRTALMG